MGNSVSVPPSDPPREDRPQEEREKSEEDCTVCGDDSDEGGRKIYIPSPDMTDPDAPCLPYMHSGCKLNRRQLGRAAWGYLHTMAVYYPENPPPHLQEKMKTYMELTAELYPCTECSYRSMEEIERNPPRVGSRAELTQWLCELHNEVNERLGAPIFQCNEYMDRWRYKNCD